MTALLARLRRRPDPDAFDRRLVAPMILGSLLNPVNSSLIAVALVPIGIALGAPAAETAWLVSGLYLATAVGQPVTGRLVDLYGPRPLYLAGTALVGIGGWRATFTVNVPLALACLVLGARRLPRGTRHDRATGLAATVDLAGIVLFTVTLVGVLLVLMNPVRWPLIAVVALAGVALVVRELRAPAPFLDLRMRTFFYLGAISASTTGGLVFAHGATTAGVHELALVMLAAADRRGARRARRPVSAAVYGDAGGR